MNGFRKKTKYIPSLFMFFMLVACREQMNQPNYLLSKNTSFTVITRESASDTFTFIPFPSPTMTIFPEVSMVDTFEPTQSSSPKNNLSLPKGYRIISLVFSPDGSKLAVGGGDDNGIGIVELWNNMENILTSENHPYRLIIPHASEAIENTTITSLAFTSDGKFLIAGSESGDILIWDGDPTGDGIEPIRIIPLKDAGLHLENYEQPVSSTVVSSPQGDMIAAAYAPYSVGVGGIVLWDITNGELIRTIPAYGIDSLSFSPDGQLLAVGSSMGKVALWSVITGGGVRDYGMEEKDGSGITGIAFALDGKTIAATPIDGKVYLFNTYHNEVIWNINCNLRADIVVVSFSPDGKRINVGIAKSLFIIDVKGQIIEKKEVATDEILSMVFSYKDNILAIGDAGGTITLWNYQALLDQ